MYCEIELLKQIAVKFFNLFSMFLILQKIPVEEELVYDSIYKTLTLGISVAWEYALKR